MTRKQELELKREKGVYEMNQHQLITAYKSMLYVARNEGIEIEEKYEELDELLLQNYDYDITDMLDNMEVIYNQLKEIV